MQAALSNDEFVLFRDLIEKECGIALQPEKMYLVESRLTSMMVEAGCQNFTEFYMKATRDPLNKLKAKIIDAMTTNETLWFRDRSPFDILESKIFPEMVEQIESGQRSRIRIWSAAASTGQEAYSVAITAMEYARKTGKSKLTDLGRLSIVGTDISPSVITIARNGRYNQLAMSRGMDPAMKERYFEEKAPLWEVRPEVKSMVTFDEFNLQKPFDSMGKFDIILLRNVAIYFSQSFKEQLYAKVERALNPGGYFFLGTSETLVGFQTNFKRLEHGLGQYYQVNR